jgi:hypothetical protein
VRKRDQITASELAAYWGVTPVVVRRAANRGEIPGSVSRGPRARYFFYKEEALAGWVPLEVLSWAKDLEKPGKFLLGGSELTERGGRVGLRNAALSRLHDLHVLVTSDDWLQVVNKAVEQAIGGDRHARKWLGDYLMGTPVRRVEADIEVKTGQGFSDEMRASAIEALLTAASSRKTVIDVEPNESGSNQNRKVPG